MKMMTAKSRKAGCLDMNIHLTRKQRIMWNRLNDGQWKEVLFYGASRSGKTFVILYWLIVQCVAHKANCLVLRNLFTSLQTGMLQQTLPAVLNAIAKHNGYAKWQEITMKDGTPFAKYNGKDNYLMFYKRFLQFMDEPAITSKDIVMLGNSLTEGGGDWSARLGKKNVRNRGIIGDEVMGIYDRLHQILPGHPAKLFLLIGVNDISHDLAPDSIVDMIRMTVERIRKESPDTKLYLQSLLPFNESFGRYKKLTGKTDMVPEINSRLEAFAKEEGIAYINLFPLFTEKGTNVLRSELTGDGLHLNEDGYKIWVKAIKKKI